jgi:hypothetical protein
MTPDWLIYNERIGVVAVYRVRRRGVWVRGFWLACVIWLTLFFVVAANARSAETAASMLITMRECKVRFTPTVNAWVHDVSKTLFWETLDEIADVDRWLAQVGGEVLCGITIGRFREFMDPPPAKQPNEEEAAPCECS